jgi:hypothetical protein
VAYRLLGLGRGTPIGRAAIGVAIAIAVGAAVYLAAAVALRAPEPAEFLRLLRRRNPAATAASGDAT